MNMILKSIWIYACNTARYAVTLILGYGLYLSNKYALHAPSNPTQPFFAVGCFQSVIELGNRFRLVYGCKVTTVFHICKKNLHTKVKKF